MLQALRAAGLPDEEIPAHCHRLAVLLVALIPSDAGIGTVTPEDREQGLGQLRVAVLGAAPSAPRPWPTWPATSAPERGPSRRLRGHPGPAHLDHIEAAAERAWSRRRTDRRPVSLRQDAAPRPS